MLTDVIPRAALLVMLYGCVTSDPLQSDPRGGSDSGAGGGGGSPSEGGADEGSGSTGGEGGGSQGLGGMGGEGGSAPFCGDGAVNPPEQCDDSNALSGDGCDGCLIECEAGALQDLQSGHCYRLFSTASNQFTAAASCQSWGGAPGIGNLVSIADAAENALVAPLVTANAWIGADDLGGAWAWSDDTPYSFENFQLGEPNHPGTEHCMFMDIEARWHDHDCTDMRAAFLCERRGAGSF